MGLEVPDFAERRKEKTELGLLVRIEESRWSLDKASELSHILVHCLSQALAAVWRDLAAWISSGWREGVLKANRSR